MKKTKIICTMGPSTDDAALLAEMMRSGMDLARFNFSHGCMVFMAAMKTMRAAWN